jgi:hypothetical protein
MGGNKMKTPSSKADNTSGLFQGAPELVCPVEQFPDTNYIFDSARYDSEGNWAFCVFDSDNFLAARFGFQKGGFNITDRDITPDKTLLQLHLELVTNEGAVLWVPTGLFSIDGLSIADDDLSIELKAEGRSIFTINGWPDSHLHFCSVEGDVEVDLKFTVSQVTLLPDCVLPYSIFAMWQTVADISGRVRYKDRFEEVRGKVFFDHPRIVSKRSDVTVRNSYLYTTIAFEDGSVWYSYHAADKSGAPIPYYCFGDFIDTDDTHSYSTDTRLLEIRFDKNNLPRSWKISWTGKDCSIRIDASVRPFSILKSWGGAGAPENKNDFWIYPFVLDCTARIESGGRTREIKGRGLPEYFNLEYWEAH